MFTTLSHFLKKIQNSPFYKQKNSPLIGPYRRTKLEETKPNQTPTPMTLTSHPFILTKHLFFLFILLLQELRVTVGTYQDLFEEKETTPTHNGNLTGYSISTSSFWFLGGGGGIAVFFGYSILLVFMLL